MLDVSALADAWRCRLHLQFSVNSVPASARLHDDTIDDEQSLHPLNANLQSCELGIH